MLALDMLASDGMLALDDTRVEQLQERARQSPASRSHRIRGRPAGRRGAGSPPPRDGHRGPCAPIHSRSGRCRA